MNSLALSPNSSLILTPDTAAGTPDAERDINRQLQQLIFTAINEGSREKLAHIFKTYNQHATAILQLLLTTAYPNDDHFYHHDEDVLKDAEELLGPSCLGLNAIHIACMLGEEEVAFEILEFVAAFTVEIEAKKVLYEFMGRVWGNGNTVLHLAAFMGMADFVKRLLELGGAPNKLNERKYKPVDCADDDAMRDIFTTVTECTDYCNINYLVAPISIKQPLGQSKLASKSIDELTTRKSSNDIPEGIRSAPVSTSLCTLNEATDSSKARQFSDVQKRHSIAVTAAPAPTISHHSLQSTQGAKSDPDFGVKTLNTLAVHLLQSTPPSNSCIPITDIAPQPKKKIPKFLRKVTFDPITQIFDICSFGDPVDQILLPTLRSSLGLPPHGSDVMATGSKKIDVNQIYTGHQWLSPLHQACTSGNLGIVELLITLASSQVNLKDKEGWTALHCACAEGHIEIIRFLCRCQGGHSLLEPGRIDYFYPPDGPIDLEPVNADGETPEDVAFEDNNSVIIGILNEYKQRFPCEYYIDSETDSINDQICDEDEESAEIEHDHCSDLEDEEEQIQVKPSKTNIVGEAPSKKTASSSSIKKAIILMDSIQANAADLLEKRSAYLQPVENSSISFSLDTGSITYKSSNIPISLDNQQVSPIIPLSREAAPLPKPVQPDITVHADNLIESQPTILNFKSNVEKSAANELSASSQAAVDILPPQNYSNTTANRPTVVSELTHSPQIEDPISLIPLTNVLVAPLEVGDIGRDQIKSPSIPNSSGQFITSSASVLASTSLHESKSPITNKIGSFKQMFEQKANALISSMPLKVAPGKLGFNQYGKNGIATVASASVLSPPKNITIPDLEQPSSPIKSSIIFSNSPDAISRANVGKNTSLLHASHQTAILSHAESEKSIKLISTDTRNALVPPVKFGTTKLAPFLKDHSESQFQLPSNTIKISLEINIPSNLIDSSVETLQMVESILTTPIPTLSSPQESPHVRRSNSEKIKQRNLERKLVNAGSEDSIITESESEGPSLFARRSVSSELFEVKNNEKRALTVRTTLKSSAAPEPDIIPPTPGGTSQTRRQESQRLKNTFQKAESVSGDFSWMRMDLKGDDDGAKAPDRGLQRARLGFKRKLSMPILGSGESVEPLTKPFVAPGTSRKFPKSDSKDEPSSLLLIQHESISMPEPAYTTVPIASKHYHGEEKEAGVPIRAIPLQKASLSETSRISVHSRGLVSADIKEKMARLKGNSSSKTIALKPK